LNPFPGLRPFGEEDEVLFFGRERQVDDLLGRLRRSRFVAVVGTSGSGKSSLVRAGLLPALHGGFMAGAGSRWRIVVLRPGNQPLSNLAAALDREGLVADFGSTEARLGLARAALERGALGLVELLRGQRLGPDENVLVVVDQFEELFRFRQQDPEEAALFVKLVLEATHFEGLPFYSVITMRADFIGDCAQFNDLPETINDGLYLVPRMSRDQLWRAIEGPVGVAEGAITPRLLARLLNEIGNEADQLPVLQHALMRTWAVSAKEATGPVELDVPVYERIGELAHALSQHGDELYEKFDERQRALTERMFKCLTELAGDGRGIRRPTSFSELCAVVGAEPDELLPMIEAFRAPDCSFLMPPPDVPISPTTIIDITHESLMRTWARLVEWVREEAGSAQEYRRLATATALRARKEAALWRDPDLGVAERWRAGQVPNPAWAKQYSGADSPKLEAVSRFIDDGVRERRKGVQLRWFAALGTTVALIALVATTAYAIVRSSFSDTVLRHEGSAKLAELSEQHGNDKGMSALLAAESYGAETSPETSGALLAQLTAYTGLHAARVPAWQSGAFTAHGALLALLVPPGKRATGRGPSDLLVFDVHDLSERGRLAGVPSRFLCAFDAAPRVVLADDTTLEVVDVSGSAPQVLGRARSGNIAALACDRSGRSIAFAQRDGTLWTVAVNGAANALTTHRIGRIPNVRRLYFSPEDELAVLAGTDNALRIELWDVAKQQLLNMVPLNDTCATSTAACRVAFSQDDKLMTWCSHDELYLAEVGTTKLGSTPLKCSFSTAYPFFEPSEMEEQFPIVAEPDGVAEVDKPGKTWAYLINYQSLATPVVDENAPKLATDEDPGLRTRYVFDFNAPTIVRLRDKGWPDTYGYAFSGSKVYRLEDTGKWSSYDLDRSGTTWIQNYKVNYSHKVRDVGDGVHAVSVNFDTGELDVWDLTKGPAKIATFTVERVPTKGESYLDNPDLAYDPDTKIVTYLNQNGLRQFAIGKGEIKSAITTLAPALKKLRVSLTDASLWLSGRGKYVTAADANSKQYLLTIDGQFLSRLDRTVDFSADDQYFFGSLYEDSSSAEQILAYQLPTLDPVLGFAVDSPDLTIGFSSDHRLVAFLNDAGQVQLYDFNAREPIGAGLPEPPGHDKDKDHHTNGLAFTSDGRYLMQRYESPQTGSWLAFYVVDPQVWEREACFVAAPNMDYQAQKLIVGFPVDPDPCASFAPLTARDLLPLATPAPRAQAPGKG